MNTGIDKANALLSVGKGWKDLIERVYKELEKYPYFYIVQVKEKFGGLRIYYHMKDEEILDKEDRNLFVKEDDNFYNFLQNIETESFKTCEDCGGPGKLVEQRGWWTTICPKCIKAVKDT